MLLVTDAAGAARLAPLRTPAGEQCEEIVDDETELANPPLTLAAQP